MKLQKNIPVEIGYTTGHAAGTRSMCPKGIKCGVIDPDLRVKGVSGLRIVNSSVLLIFVLGAFLKKGCTNCDS